MKIEQSQFSFLDELSPENISNIQSNFRLKSAGYNIFYVVDTYDIMQYCFPSVFGKHHKTSANYYGANYLSYQYLFFRYPNKPIILDEYKSELYSCWYNLSNKIKELNNYDDLYSDLLTKYNLFETKEEKIDFVQSNAGPLLALVFGTLSKTPLDRYNKLISERLQIERFETEDLADRDVIEQVFLDTSPNKEKVNEVFDSFCDSVKFRLFGKKEEEQFVYLENSYRDILVFDRIVNINKKINSFPLKDNLRQKYVFLYLSSTPVKSKFIQETYFKEIPIILGNTNLKIHRTNFETYLYSLFNIEGVSIETRINLLDQFSGIALDYAKFKKLFKKISGIDIENHDDIPDNIKALLDCESIDSSLLELQTIALYLNNIDSAIKIFSDHKNDTELLREFKNVLELANKKDIKERLAKLSSDISLYGKTLNSEIGNITPSLVSGAYEKKEIIISPYNTDNSSSFILSCPFFLFWNNKEFGIQELISSRIQPYRGGLKIRLDLIGFNQASTKISSKFSVKVFYLWLNNFHSLNTLDQANSLLNELAQIRIINKKRKLKARVDAQKGKLLVKYEEDLALAIEIAYIESWVLRKTGKYDQAISQIAEFIRLTSQEDIRLIQTRALCYLSKFYTEIDFKSNKALAKLLDDAILDLKLCEEFFMADNNSKNSIIFVFNLLAISSTICEVNLKLYSLDMLDKKAAEGVLIDCRGRINSIKQQVSNAKFKYEYFPEFMLREVELEFYETILLADKNEIEQAKIKIKYAILRINALQRSGAYKDLKYFKRLREEIDRLAWELGD